ncbi:hypothetical protein GE21DRAFT_258 [Neurospora crassa]|uniref:Uncharacterized protein n=1 Tax=Neurospora crassa (strain ATCC 24698 / 74-OR23-1A / CBS 708.71 / DSM 1257 / FGSC 987) TaxID=367110 RepID=Q7SEQ4_NEUCR|nr:hypothetical protein NCU02163 [Neurospora crassa OR74A]EAA35286.2 hypothetical protein NCU02163 [Neurospora crassa OR74A]KHE83972.1 hypothetical protein GE21DRAFT_258 [Neurospora crassa]|eukprot:XP_964522.2 hypothetical protein NCU02163 [Neurospora crassa OR74A]
MSSPGAGSLSTLSSYASSAPDHQGQHAIGLPLPATAQPTTARTTTTLPPVSPSSTANATNFLTNNSSTPSNNINNNNNNNNNTPNLLNPTRTATINFNLLPELETGLDIDRLNYLCQKQQFITTTSTDKQPEEEEEPEELGWKDAYEVMIKVPLQGLAAWARRWRRARTERGQGMV